MTLRCLCLILYLNILYSHQHKIINILIDNPDSIEMKNLIFNNSEYVSHEYLNSSEVVTYENLITVEKEFENYTANSSSGLTVRNFYLFTREYHKGKYYEILNPKNISSIKYSHFLSRKSYFIVHGFLGNGLEAWVLSLKDKLLIMEDCNILSVDWPAGDWWFLPTYMAAAGRVPLVGNDTAYLLQSLLDHKGLLLEQVQFLGHSLGAHVSGFAAKPFDGRIGRITGLDPAGPYFHKVNSSRRLDKSDAIYVDVMHTNACNKWPYWTDCYGLNENIGHSNFFPNGGQHQPGCSSIVQELAGSIGCDHERAYMYYTGSLDFGPSTTYFLSRPCESWILYEIGNCTCGKNAQYMGYNVNTEVDGVFYLDTLSYPPYGVEDPDCPTHRQWNILIILCYVIVGGFVSCCFFSVLVLAVESLKRACCTNSPSDEENLLESSDEDGEDDDDDEEDDGGHTDREGEEKEGSEYQRRYINTVAS